MKGMYRIKVENDKGESIEIVISDESDIDELANTFRVLLAWMTFTDYTIKQILKFEDDLEQ
jgi:hypothetical protein